MSHETFVGLDVHKSTVVATAVDALGHKVSHATLGPKDSELVEYLRGLPGEKRVVLEACCVWEHFYDAAVSTGAEVTLAHPAKTRIISEASLKSDKVDSHALATLLRLKAVPPAFAPGEEMRKLRRLIRDRLFYKRQIQAVRNHTYAVLLTKGIPYDDRILGTKRKREQLRAHNIPEVNRGLDVLIHLDAECEAVDLAVRAAYDASREAQLINSIPGMGAFTSVALVSFLCPIERFSNIDKVCSYAGLAPTNFQSGKVSHHGRLKADCNHTLKWLLIEAAWRHQSKSKTSDISKTAKRIARRRGKNKGGVAAGHKLLKTVYAVLKRGTPYTHSAPTRPGCNRDQAEP